MAGDPDPDAIGVSLWLNRRGTSAGETPADHFFLRLYMLLMGINMGAVKKAIAYTAWAAIAWLVFYELSRMMKRKTETGPTEMERTEMERTEIERAETESYETAPREPGDYRSIYNL